MRRIRDIFNQGPQKPQFYVTLVDALLFHENGLAITLPSGEVTSRDLGDDVAVEETGRRKLEYGVTYLCNK